MESELAKNDSSQQGQESAKKRLNRIDDHAANLPDQSQFLLS